MFADDADDLPIKAPGMTPHSMTACALNKGAARGVCGGDKGSVQARATKNRQARKALNSNVVMQPRPGF